MSVVTEQVDRIADQIADRVRRHIIVALSQIDDQLVMVGELVDRIGGRAAEYAVIELLAHRGTSVIGRRIGPVYSVADLARWLVKPGADLLTGEAVRKRAVKRQLVAFRTDDNQWAFPAWQFHAAAGRLVVRAEVIRLWRALPHDGWRTDVDLAAWMNTRLDSMDQAAPSGFAHVHGADHPLVTAAVSRLSAAAA